MSLGKYLNKNKIGALILIIVIVIAFGFGGFGGGFLSNNQNNIVKINKSNITSQDLINYINQIKKWILGTHKQRLAAESRRGMLFWTSTCKGS